ncbi:MAG: hypothetical protein GY925_06960 [Actinomycetia bacterium]|nr:hypothetical protein [Actinomycetes bacterium]
MLRASELGSSDPNRDEPPEGGSSGARPASVARNTFWSLAAEGMRLVSGLGTFLILVRVYEPRLFGIFVATTGVFAFAFPQASVGAGWLVLRRVASENWRPEEALSRAFGMVFLGGAVVGIGLVALRPLLLPEASLALFLGIGISEMILIGLVEVTLFAAQATEKLIAKAAVWTTFGVGRLVAALAIFLVLDEPDLSVWVGANILVSVVVLIIAQLLTVGRLVRPRWPLMLDIRQGIPFSVGFGADRLRNVSDTVMLVRFGFDTDAGLYSAARRLINVAQTPIIATQHATNARLFQAGSESVASCRRLAMRLTALAVLFGFAAMLAIALLGRPLVSLLSDSYRDVGQVMVWMSFLPMMLALETFAGMALTASGHHGRRVALNLLTGGVNVVLNLVLIPIHGWRGAVVATLTSSLVYSTGLWATLAWAVRKEASDHGIVDPLAALHPRGTGDRRLSPGRMGRIRGCLGGSRWPGGDSS